MSANARPGIRLPCRAALAVLAGIAVSTAIGCGTGLMAPWHSASDDAGAYADAGWAPGPPVTSVQTFYDELSAHGTWIADAEHGYVFAPADATFRPYERGRWVRTEYGLTWVSTAPFGWATAHYGRWIHRDRWVWRPDTQWGPAWVQWRESEDGLVGWAPLGVASTTPRTMPRTGWRFVRRGRLFSRHLAGYYLSEAQLRGAVRRARPVRRWLEDDAGNTYVAGPDTSEWRAPVRSRTFRELSPRYERQRKRARTGYRVAKRPRAARAAGVRFSRAPIAMDSRRVRQLRRAAPYRPTVKRAGPTSPRPKVRRAKRRR